MSGDLAREHWGSLEGPLLLLAKTIMGAEGLRSFVGPFLFAEPQRAHIGVDKEGATTRAHRRRQ